MSISKAKDQEAIAKSKENDLGPTIMRIACGLYHNLAVTKFDPDGSNNYKHEVYTWGTNKYNVLGLGDHVPEKAVPTVITNFSKYAIHSVACGTNHSLVICKSLDGEKKSVGGTVYSFGLGDRGRLGVAAETDEVRSNLREVTVFVLLCLLAPQRGREQYTIATPISLISVCFFC